MIENVEWFVEGIEWPYVFRVAVWTIWNKRNDMIFNNTSEIPHVVQLKTEILKLAQSFVLAWGKSFDGGIIKLAKSIMIKWVNPEFGLKLNIDGSFNESKRNGGIGGIVRDSKGTCVSGFVGPCLAISPLMSEIFALHFGLRWAINNNYNELCIETDSEELHALVKGGGSSNHHIDQNSKEFHALVKGGGNSSSCCVSFVRECYAMLEGNLSFKINRIYREGNLCVDKLAKEGVNMYGQPVTFNDSPDYLWDLITRDRSGSATARVVLEKQ